MSQLPAATPVAELMDPDPPTTAPDTDQEVAAWRAVQHGESSLALVDDDGRLLGVVPPHRLLAVLLAEHDEDVARLAGLPGTTDPARTASREPVRRRLAHRLPWLLLGLGGALLTAALMGGFEERLAANVMIAFFVPGIVYMADAVGTQTETLLIRGLSVGVGVRQVLGRVNHRAERVVGHLVFALLASRLVVGVDLEDLPGNEPGLAGQAALAGLACYAGAWTEGSGGAAVLATLQGLPALVASDIIFA